MTSPEEQFANGIRQELAKLGIQSSDGNYPQLLEACRNYLHARKQVGSEVMEEVFDIIAPSWRKPPESTAKGPTVRQP